MVHGPAYIALMLKYALALSGYTMPAHAQPALVELTHAQMIDSACDGFRPCNVYGYYKDDEVIYIDPFLIKHDHMSLDGVVVHELTHWLQQHHGHGGFTCKAIGFREREAYGVENAYLDQIEHSFSYVVPPGWDC